MNRAIAAAALGAMALCLPACENEAATPTMGKAEGEILPRSVADDMLPYDTLQSQPPLAAPEDATAPGGAGSRAGGDAEAAREPASAQESDSPAPADGASRPMPDAE